MFVFTRYVVIYIAVRYARSGSILLLVPNMSGNSIFTLHPLTDGKFALTALTGLD